MLTLTQSASVRGSAGDPLPGVWENLTESGTQFRRGQLALIAAGPGTGKSAFVLNYALRSGVSCMYFSADSDAFVQLARSLADRKSTRLNSSHQPQSRMPSSA